MRQELEDAGVLAQHLDEIELVHEYDVVFLANQNEWKFVEESRKLRNTSRHPNGKFK